MSRVIPRQVLHVRRQLSLQVPVQNLGPLRGSRPNLGPFRSVPVRSRHLPARGCLPRRRPCVTRRHCFFALFKRRPLPSPRRVHPPRTSCSERARGVRYVHHRKLRRPVRLEANDRKRNAAGGVSKPNETSRRVDAWRRVGTRGGHGPTRSMASAMFMPLMSHPSNTMSFGSTMGSRALNGVYTSWQGSV